MNIFLTLTSILIFAFSLLPSQLYAAANTYYVTQNGNGARSGESLGNAMAVSDFNALTGTGYAGDTFYFSGAISSEVELQIQGTAGGGHITLDGYEAGDCDAISESCSGQAIITLKQAIGQYGIALYKSAFGANGGRDYVIIQDFEINEVGTGIYGAEDCDHITIRRNFIHDGLDDGIAFTAGRGGNGCNNITIGGSGGDGNVIKDFGVGTGMTDILLAASNDIVVSYNHLYATKSNGNSGDRGIDGIVPMNGTYNVLIEYNSIHDHQDDYYSDAYGCGSSCKGRGEDGIDIKDDNCGAGESGSGTHDIIIRFNHIYNNRQGNIHPQSCTYNVYIYGNRLYSSNWGGVYIKEGASGASKPVSYLHIFSNLIYNERDAGSRVHSDSGGTTDKAHHIIYFNNTFDKNGIDNHGNTFTHITAEVNPDDFSIKNNIFLNSRPGYSTYQSRQVYLSHSIKYFDYNHYYWPGKSSQICISGKCANAIGGFDAIETNSSEGDPGLTDIDNHDYTITPGSAVIGTGVDMGSGAIANVTIQGVVYPVYWDVALGPSTDWSVTPPVVQVLHRDIVGWDIGAYAYEERSEKPVSGTPPDSVGSEKPVSASAPDPPDPVWIVD